MIALRSTNHLHLHGLIHMYSKIPVRQAPEITFNIFTVSKHSLFPQVIVEDRYDLFSNLFRNFSIHTELNWGVVFSLSYSFVFFYWKWWLTGYLLSQLLILSDIIIWWKVPLPLPEVFLVKFLFTYAICLHTLYFTPREVAVGDDRKVISKEQKNSYFNCSRSEMVSMFHRKQFTIFAIFFQVCQLKVFSFLV